MPDAPLDPASKSMDDIVALAKRRGFVYPASEIYGGLRGFWDYGPLGTALKNNIRDWWWRCMVECPPIGPDGDPVAIVGLDSAIIQNPKTWQHSGHVAGFTDPLVDCTETQKRYRADHVVIWVNEASDGPHLAFMENEEPNPRRVRKFYKDLPELKPISFMEISDEQRANAIGPDATKPGSLTEPRTFNLMLDTFPGPIRDEENKAYLRPETAQGIFLNFKNVLDTMRVKVPFGIAQIGKSFRNEVTPRNFIFRSREFEQMEMEFFCPPDESQKWYEFWRDERFKWWLSLGIAKENLILRDHADDELAHYSSACVDVEYRYP
ncbi:MAG: glycine--tRNA ligase, partial [Planctomycetota bacterium]